jgi:hypothetical protein
MKARWVPNKEGKWCQEPFFELQRKYSLQSVRIELEVRDTLFLRRCVGR